MGFRLHCEACGRFIKTVGIREIRDMNYVDDEPVHCDKCEKAFQDLERR
jgi:predicted  nucleic acid-binding Zn-ribbon protein